MRPTSILPLSLLFLTSHVSQAWAEPAPSEKPDVAPSPAQAAPVPETTPTDSAAAETSDESASPASESEAPADGQIDPAADPTAEPTDKAVVSEEAGDGESEEAAEEPPSGEPLPQSASANQATEIPGDDYDGATDDALVEQEKEGRNLSLGIALDLTWPLGRVANFIGSASIQGLSLDLRYYAWGNIGIGAGVALDSLSMKTAGTVVWNNATITGTQLREISYTPLLAKGYYAWRDQERFIPYVAMGVGAARAVRRLLVGFTSLSEANWHFAMVPEAGLQIPAGPTMLLTNVRLGYLPPSGGAEEQLFANVGFGLSIQ